MRFIEWEEIARGKKIAFAMIIFINSFYIFVYAYHTIVVGTDSLLKEVIELALIITVTIFFYKGSRLAEWFTMMLLVYPLLIIGFLTLRYLGLLGKFGGWTMLIASIFIFGLIITILSRRSSVQAFLEYQRNKR